MKVSLVSPTIEFPSPKCAISNAGSGLASRPSERDFR